MFVKLNIQNVFSDIALNNYSLNISEEKKVFFKNSNTRLKNYLLEKQTSDQVLINSEDPNNYISAIYDTLVQGEISDVDAFRTYIINYVNDIDANKFEKYSSLFRYFYLKELEKYRII